MSRRQTLAGLSPSQLNTRSAAPGRNGKDGAALPAKGRKSLAVGLVADRPSGMGLDRRSSAFGTTKPGGPKQDPRPLNSKDYQAACIRTVITYLSTHSFPAAVSPKTLASPTGKDFSTIVTFLFQQVDPTFRIQSKVEDEVPVFFKRLNYPFQISKSALFAVGSPHSWPAVLAALTWLVELLSYMEKADDSSGPAFERENKVSLAGVFFMVDSEAELARLEADLKAALQLLVAHKEAVASAVSRAAGAVRHAKAELQAGRAGQPAFA
ncbi:Kinetochore protein NDC80 [Tetrabaena socialis]|uniref:Kinetochore protein NDC80 n=1 Tax=Tetrabaena socialis TaxID=47790 RepID=A0A2J7ZT19_9CHLO|nr:Kinetochore protein NDC80 [Tetrabaena socialis]|eukprot:PNH03415.1 Kinetochore protein NDC80 [Tetrabaena socialis]